MYRVRQTTTKKRFFNLLEKTTIKEYNFKGYNKAVIFALSEQIKIIYSIPCEDCKPILKRPFEIYMKEGEFLRAAKKNPLHYVGIRNIKNVDLKNYYYYLVSSNNLQKLKKHI